MIKLPIYLDLNIPLLESIFDNMTNSYKLYWFLGIFEEVCNGKKQLSFREVVLRMVSIAWYPLLKFKLHFGSQDQLYKLVKDINRLYISDIEITPNKLYYELSSITSKDFDKLIAPLYKYVPYRLLTPFYASELRGMKDYDKDKFIEFKSSKDFSVLYRISSNDKSLCINDNWFNYLYENQNIIGGWVNYKLILFLQNKNPNTPAIPLKLSAPQERNLVQATKFWTSFVESTPIRDIYSGLEFNSINKDNLGSMSIDHFIPWSFVLHDEMWNLVPTFRNVNSSKSDLLPTYDAYIDTFCNIQFQALSYIKSNTKFKKILDDYITISPTFDIKSFLQVETTVNRDMFTRDLNNSIKPLYQIAYNQGFKEWKFNSDIIKNKEILM